MYYGSACVFLSVHFINNKAINFKGRHVEIKLNILKTYQCERKCVPISSS